MSRISVGGLQLANPVMPASGTFGFGHEMLEHLPVKRLGAIITKAITLKPRQGNPPPRLQETNCGLMNWVGLENPGLETFLRDILPKIRDIGPPIIANIAGNRAQDYIDLAKALDQAVGVAGIELNVSCPNVEHGTELGRNKQALKELIQRVKAQVSLPLWVKLTPFLVDVVEVARAAQQAGADALVVANTYRGLWIRDDGSEFNGGLSGPCILPLSLFLVRQVSSQVSLPVIGVGGISSAKDVIRYLRAGATAVQIGSANLVDPMRMFKIIDQLETMSSNTSQ